MLYILHRSISQVVPCTYFLIALGTYQSFLDDDELFNGDD